MMLQHRIAILEAAILRPPVSTLTDTQLQDRIDGYLTRLAVDPDPELAAAARTVQDAPDSRMAFRWLRSTLRASLAQEAR